MWSYSFNNFIVLAMIYRLKSFQEPTNRIKTSELAKNNRGVVAYDIIHPTLKIVQSVGQHCSTWKYRYLHSHRPRILYFPLL